MSNLEQSNLSISQKFMDLNNRYQLDFQKSEVKFQELNTDLQGFEKKINSIEREMHSKVYNDDFKNYKL